MHTCCSLFLTQEHKETHVGTIVQYCLSFHLINDWIFSQDHDSCHGVWSHGISNTWLGYLRVTVSLGNKERTINMLYCFRCCCCLVLFVCFNKQLILCKFSRQPLTSEWGSGQSCLEPVWLYFPEFTNSSPCSGSLSLLGSCGSQNSSLLIFWWHHICVHVLVTFPD